MPGMPCSSASSTPTNISDKQTPDLVATKPLEELHPLRHSPSNEEADQEVAVICRAPEYYRVRSHIRCRCRRQHNKNDHVIILQVCRDHLLNTKR